MNKETAEYIITYFSNLLTTEEKLALKHSHSVVKLGLDEGKINTSLIKIYKEKGWLSEDQNILDLLGNGFDSFQIKVAERILDKCGEDVFLNKCPKCGKLARTPFAKQCRFCNYNWRQ